MRAKQFEAALPRSVAGKMPAVPIKPLCWSGLSSLLCGALPDPDRTPFGTRRRCTCGGDRNPILLPVRLPPLFADPSSMLIAGADAQRQIGGCPVMGTRSLGEAQSGKHVKRMRDEAGVWSEGDTGL